MLASAWVKGWNSRPRASAVRPMPVSRTSKRRRRAAGIDPARAGRGGLTSPAFGELDGVADQVDQHLLQAQRVAQQPSRLAAARRPASVRPFLRAVSAQQVSDAHAPLAVRAKGRFSSSSWPASILEKSRMSLMMLQEGVARPRGCAGSSPTDPGVSGSCVQQLGQAQHGVHGRADFMARVRQEARLGGIGRPGCVVPGHLALQIVVQLLKLFEGLLELGDVFISRGDGGLCSIPALGARSSC
jgi:hypothetical protein